MKKDNVTDFVSKDEQWEKAVEEAVKQMRTLHNKFVAHGYTDEQAYQLTRDFLLDGLDMGEE